jgi:hypothetical protein
VSRSVDSAQRAGQEVRNVCAFVVFVKGNASTPRVNLVCQG